MYTFKSYVLNVVCIRTYLSYTIDFRSKVTVNSIAIKNKGWSPC